MRCGSNTVFRPNARSTHRRLHSWDQHPPQARPPQSQHSPEAYGSAEMQHWRTTWTKNQIGSMQEGKGKKCSSYTCQVLSHPECRISLLWTSLSQLLKAPFATSLPRSAALFPLARYFILLLSAYTYWCSNAAQLLGIVGL